MPLPTHAPCAVVGAAQTNPFVRWFIFLWPLAACALLLASRNKTTT